MTDFKEINYLPNSSSDQTTSTTNNGSITIEVEAVVNFDTSGTLYAVDTLGTLQKLTYIGVSFSDENFLRVSSWEGTGNLGEFVKVYGNYYTPHTVTMTERTLSSGSMTERVIS